MSAQCFDSLGEWLSWMESLHPKEIDLGLDRVTRVAERLDVLSFDAPVVMVAGTNGKGSFVKALSALLLADGLKVGSYTSPHILKYNERITLNGRAVADEDICQSFERIDQAREELSLTYFEFSTLAALDIFKSKESKPEEKLDVIILEVGLGGRLDAVNIISPDFAVITSIGLDHEAWLGNDRESIGYEKAGILRGGIPFVCVDTDIPESVKMRSDELQCQAYYLGDQLSFTQKQAHISFSIYDEKAQKQQNICLEQAYLPLPSLLAAAQIYWWLSPLADQISTAKVLSSLSLEGRYERIRHHQTDYILDVAHNPQAAQLLAETLSNDGYTRVIVVLATMSDKDVYGIIEPLEALADSWISTEIPSLPRSMSATELDACLKQRVVSQVECKAQPSEAFNLAETMYHNAIRSSSSQLQPQASKSAVLVLGSFFLAAEFKKYILSNMALGVNDE